MAVTQPAKYGEEWCDERIAHWLNLQAPEGVNRDYHLLMRAYQSMRPHDFERFLAVFSSQGHDVDARNENGETLLCVINRHEQAGEFQRILKDAGSSL